MIEMFTDLESISFITYFFGGECLKFNSTWYTYCNNIFNVIFNCAWNYILGYGLPGLGIFLF